MPLWIFSVLGYVKDNWKVIAIAAAVIAAIMYVQSLRLEIAHQETQIVQLTNDNATLKHNAETLEIALKNQNDAIGKIDDLAKVTRQSFAKLGVDVAAQSSSLSATLASILKDKKPKTCEETITYLIEAQKGYAK